MRFYRILSSLANKHFYCRYIHKYKDNSNFIKSLTSTKTNNHDHFHIQKQNSHFDAVNGNKDLFDVDDIQLIESEILDDSECARNLLFSNSQDILIQNLTKSASLEDVFTVFNEHQKDFTHQHLTQLIFVLHDLHMMYLHVNSSNDSNNLPRTEFVKTIYESPEFWKILRLIKTQLNTFDSTCLSYSLLYLTKLGMRLDYHLIQDIDNFLKFKLENEFDLHEAAIYLKAIFVGDHIKPIYQTKNIIPHIFNTIDKCDNLKDFGDLTTCLNKLNMVVNMNTVYKYEEKVRNFINKKILNAEEYKVVLKIIMFLNYPNWRTYNAELISECILLIKDKIDVLGIDELILLYGVFFKNQEPGEILDIMQRNASKYIQQIEEYSPGQVDKKIKLFSSLIYFSSPLHKIEYRNLMKDYVESSTTLNELFQLRKIICYVKISDENLCNMFWDKVFKALNKENCDPYYLCQSYLNFNTDVEDYRHYTIEKLIKRRVNVELLDSNVTLYSTNLVDVLSFQLTYGYDKSILQYLIHSLEENYTQLSDIDILRLSQQINTVKNTRKKFVNKINNILSKSTDYIMKYKTNYNPHLLLKACLLRNESDNTIRDELFFTLKDLDDISSKYIETILYCFISTDVLMPEVINKFTRYIVKNKRHILGFNVEKVLFTCYCLGFFPINGEEFFPVAADIILRDQERLSGLSFLQSALALCYFNSLPNSFIKQIFNVEFLDKLEIELANCYYKDKYPQRVRQNLMELNRAVCLEYPENNVPWFHEKYIQEMIRKKNLDYLFPKHFASSVKEHLLEVIGSKDCLLQNINTPYGYFVDFVLNLNSRQEVVSVNADDISVKIALLLVKPQSFTKFYINLKGKYQMKKRHLEMFGYKVSFINWDEWVNLLYAGERLEFIKNKIWTEDIHNR